MTTVEGFVEPGFEGVREAFVGNFEERGEVGAGCCVYLDGRPVVDLWGGLADRESGAPYDEGTLQLVFSTTKGATALCVNLLAQRGQLDLNAPVARYWPEFADAGKEEIPVRWLLDHRAGLIDVDTELTLEQALAWEPVVAALGRQKPLWEPGSAHGYHAMTYGWLVGEVVRRITGKSLGTFFADEVAAPLGLDFWIGLPEEQQHRVAPLVPWEVRATNGVAALFTGESLLVKALGAPGGLFTLDGTFNRTDVRAAELPAANGVGNARSIARMYAAVVGEVDGIRLLSESQTREAAVSENEGPDKVLIFPLQFGIGFMRFASLSKRFGDQTLGHYGAGGSVGFADPECRLAFAYVMNKMEPALVGDPRSLSLIRAVHAAIGKSAPKK